ncbi:MAG: chemoreceptor glutamine deamidase CheD [Francisellaceae bacterium]|nr:chemoreceptor glutamine deamidase CheD [Francisellaceae bacterium]MBT6207928.1 chemoreceptor glutamine deamidase CheD [Francisellaceae bacterium]MBT6539785.1 chemoreceptor glutamine deamidase CheD [Francisellaceae bacterium]
MIEHNKNLEQQFSHISRFWNSTYNRYVLKVLPGEYCVIDNNNCLSTSLGSCISVTIVDKKNKLAGMNHFMLPEDNSMSMNTYSARYGCWAMEHLVNNMLKYGAKKESMEFKCFGAGEIMKTLQTSSVAKKNISFISQYFKSENIKVRTLDVGGSHARKIFLFPETGDVMVKNITISQNASISKQEKTYLDGISSDDQGGDVDLF